MGFLVDLITGGASHGESQDEYNNAINDYSQVQNQATGGWSDFLNQSRADYAPYSAAGTGALGRMTQMETPGFQFSPSDPSYAWRLGQGTQAVDQSAAAKGGLFSGGTLKNLDTFGQGLASTEFNNDFNRNATLAGYGLDAAKGQTAAGADAAQGTSQALFAGAAGRASGYAAKAGNDQSFWGGLGGSLNGAAGNAANLFSMFG